MKLVTVHNNDCELHNVSRELKKCSKGEEVHGLSKCIRSLNDSDTRFSLNMDDSNTFGMKEKQEKTNLGSTVSIDERFEAIEKKLNDFSRVLDIKTQWIDQIAEAKDKDLDDLKNKLSDLNRRFSRVYGKRQ